MWAKTRSRPMRAGRGAYTLFEILMVLAIASVLLGITVPMISGVFGRSSEEEVVDELEKMVRLTHASAVDQSDARRILIRSDGLESEQSGMKPVVLPTGWVLEVKRMTEGKFRKPKKKEFWEFNSSGISEPLSLRLSDGSDDMTLSFDPLTGAPLSDAQ